MMRRQTERILMTVVTVLLLMTSSIAAQNNVSEAELQFREALHKQQVEGDLNGAVKMYQSLIAAKTTDRVVKAKALLQLAIAYQALGRQSEALSFYEQIVRNFGDQPAVTKAKKRIEDLRPAAPPPTMTMRKIEFGTDVENIVATDGEKAVYWDSTKTTLYFGDIKGANKRIVYRPTGRIPDVWASHDLTMVFLYLPGVEGHYAIVKTDSPGYRELTLTENGKSVGATPVNCLAWSWDKRNLAMCRQSRDGVHLVRVSIADGQTRDLLEGRASLVRRAAAYFSPDDRFIAYSEAGVVRVVSAEGGEPKLIVPRAQLGDWTRDGRYLMIEEFPATIQRTPPKVSAVPIKNGQVAGEPVTINATNLGSASTYSNGNMLLVLNGSSGEFRYFRGSLDANDHLSWTSLLLNDLGEPTDWSPDGRRIVYTSGLNSDAIRVRNLETGEDREVFRSSDFAQCLFARKEPKVFCAVTTLTQTEILAVELATGRTEKLGTFDGFRFLRRISPDDRTLVMTKFTGTGATDAPAGITVAWEFGTDSATEKPTPLYQSADGQWVFNYAFSEGRRGIMIRPASGGNGEPRLLVQTGMQPVGGRAAPVPIRFTPDSKWVLYQDKDANGKSGLYRVSVFGGAAPQRLGDYPISEDSSLFYISADGRQFLAGAAARLKPEFWVLENVARVSKPAPKSSGK
jgi:Tol biopolymer transport system component